MKFIEQTEILSQNQKKQLFHLWNNEYPIRLSYQNISEFEEYLNNLDRISHILLVDDDNKEINGWAFSFDREIVRWFAIILSEKIQRKGYGKKMLDKLKLVEKELNGWVIDHCSDIKSNGKFYKSPIDFYYKNGFQIIKEQRLELDKISAVKIKWKNE